MPGIDECLLEAMRLPGARSAAVVDWISGLALGLAGEPPGGDGEAAACETAELARMVAEYRSLGPLAAVPAESSPPTTAKAPAPAPAAHHPGTAPAVEDIIATNSDSYHLLRFVTGALDGTVFLHLWLARDEGNLALARIRLAEIAERMVL
ncbi:hypothetical protein ACH4RA_04040 [Streptomyces smyrnaeus]|uniref:hypothetical protein n=1 Tax=Streptomyces TaxID=1883 RepID=UPI001B39AD1B|nr:MULTISPECIES: hypothetical protein [unclassified Streptomyces]MBQ0863612.1 hypothetical protein [Streptomyces sp. RK75]MBQ1124153.1 hypothetical protein [Streptomyces sp. B15]